MIHHDDSVLQIMLQYAEGDDNIRAVLMEGSRAFGMVDPYSDHDLVYVTRTSEPYFDGAILPFLVESFGEIAVMQTPDNGDPHDVYTHLVQFANGIRIDLTFNSLEFLSRTPLDRATLVLMDKDGRFAHVPAPCDGDFCLERPGEEAFRHHCNEFWWCSPYVAKAIVRGQTIHGLEILNEYVRCEYRWMLARLAGVRRNWEQVNPGKHGMNIRNLLHTGDLPYWDILLDSYVPAQDKEIEAALNRLMKGYHTLAPQVAAGLGFDYNSMEGEKTMAFIKSRFGHIESSGG